jgi:hypothetical protein
MLAAEQQGRHFSTFPKMVKGQGELFQRETNN